MFTVGFVKRAALTQHNDGTEFKVVDNEPGSFVASPGGAAPSAIPTYQPNQRNAHDPIKTTRKQKLINVIMGKIATADPRDGLNGDSTQGEGSETLVSQLKYESSHDTILPQDAKWKGGLKRAKGAKK